MIKNFYIIANVNKDSKLMNANAIKEFLIAKGASCIVNPINGQWNDNTAYASPDSIPKDTDCIITLGGDGTLIRTARDLVDLNIPVIGVNLGTLGYLAELNMESVYSGLEALMLGESVIERRMLLEGEIIRGDEVIMKDIALNEIFLAKADATKVICFRLYVNREYLNEYHADGIIVATPTGSTGYNLSAGGPIVEPRSSMIVLTPVSPHSLINRSIILSESADVNLVISCHGDNSPNSLAVFDGGKSVDLKLGDRIHICRSDKVINICKISKISFYENLRYKMSDS